MTDAMTGICFEHGTSAQDVTEALRGLSGRLSADTPVLALGGRHAVAAAQAVFASAAILRLFGANALQSLSDALSDARDDAPGGRLRHLAETLPPDGPARLERLRFETGAGEQAVTFLCRKLAVANAPALFVAAALDLPLRTQAPPASKAPDAAKEAQAGGGALRFVWRTGADHRVADIGAGLTAAFGATSADLFGRALAEASFDPAGAARLAEHLTREDSFSGLEVVWRVAGSGAGVPVALAGTPRFDARRRFIGFRGFGLIDGPRLLAAQKEAEIAVQPAPAGRRFEPDQSRPEAARIGIEAELRQSQREARELAAILDTAMDGVAVLDAQGRIVALNRSGEALFGYDKAEVAGEAFTILLAPESRARADAYFAGVRSNGVASLLNDGREFRGLTRHGGAIALFMTLGKIGDGAAAGEETRYCALLRDMTHWKTVERELDDARREAERASALKSDFLARISHEIRTPLNAILGFAEVIMDERFGPIGNDRYKDYLKDIRSSGALVLSLVNDLLDLSKIESGQMDLSFESVDANRVVTECVSIMQPQASAAGVVTRLSLAPQLPHICADERSLRQIVLNLLSNAIKFTQAGGQVIVSTALTDSNLAALRIRDTGVGMSETDIAIALEPFRQVASSRASGGTGLGLPLTKALVEANRAFFSITSKLHEGTLVEAAFPPARVVAKRK